MPILPSGLNVGISDKRAQQHVAQKHIIITMDTPLIEIYPLIDVVYANDEKKFIGKSYSTFADFTLADTESFNSWSEEDQVMFWRWASTERFIWYLKTTRFRLTQCHKSPVFIKMEIPYKFYSLLEEKIQKLQLNKAGPKQWFNTIDNLSQKGVTRDEFSSTGIRMWLINQTGVVYKEDIIEKIRKSKQVVEIGYEAEEVVSDLLFKPCAWLINEADYSDINLNYKYIIARYISLKNNYKILLVKYDNEQLNNDDMGYWIVADNENKILSKNGEIEVFTAAACAMQYASEVVNKRGQLPKEYARKNTYKHEVLLGGKNYQEILVTLPNIHENYYSSHFKTRNILAHFRTTERTDVEGNKLLFVEELQSDWFSAAKKYGYTEIYDDQLAVPYVPFQREWYQLCIKILLMKTIEQGAVGMAWKPGHVHEDRAMGNTPWLIRFYDKQIPSFINKLTKSYGMEVTKTHIPTQSWNLYMLRCMKQYVYSVDSMDEGFYTRSNLTESVAELIVKRHSRGMFLEVPVVYITERFKEVVKHKGLSFYGVI